MPIPVRLLLVSFVTALAPACGPMDVMEKMEEDQTISKPRLPEPEEPFVFVRSVPADKATEVDRDPVINVVFSHTISVFTEPDLEMKCDGKVMAGRAWVESTLVRWHIEVGDELLPAKKLCTWTLTNVKRAGYSTVHAPITGSFATRQFLDQELCLKVPVGTLKLPNKETPRSYWCSNWEVRRAGNYILTAKVEGTVCYVYGAAAAALDPEFRIPVTETLSQYYSNSTVVNGSAEKLLGGGATQLEPGLLDCR